MNYSVFGQQATLSSNDTSTLKDAIAVQGRKRGTGEVAGEITIKEITVKGWYICTRSNDFIFFGQNKAS